MFQMGVFTRNLLKGYSLLCRSKPVRLSFIFGTQKKNFFNEILELSVPLLTLDHFIRRNYHFDDL